MLYVNKEIRKYDLSKIRGQEMAYSEESVEKLKLEWNKIKDFINKKLLFCEDLQEKNINERDEYIRCIEFVEPSSLRQSLEKQIKIILTESKLVDKPVKELEKILQERSFERE